MVEVQTAVGLEYTVCNRCAHYLEQEHGTTLAEQNETMQVLAQKRREKTEALGKSFAQAAAQGAQLLGIAVGATATAAAGSAAAAVTGVVRGVNAALVGG